MVTFLLFLSFLLNIISLLSIVILYSRQNRFVHMEKEQKKMISDMEDVISAYLIEMKEENDEFIRTFKTKVQDETEGFGQTNDMNQDNGQASDARTIRTGAGYKVAQKAYQQTNNLISEPAHPTEQMKMKQPENDPLIQQVILLKEKGMPIEEIAKSVGKGQTEIELLLKFRQIM
ncbi:hypothetical protein FGG79_06525 [Bacillus sp. BHET2]|uniref:hypothetical protein n=1 Tax=Bacillus sp. BHET2 TaxID=2583818 RepID=UPI001486A821|nr:hypothetical protein [Bacillus sp. BHET2]TMU87762.1 hypothetical protein FGG79_06525 [Bacillus sp. BHET2]